MQEPSSAPSTLHPIQILLTTDTGRHLYHYVHPKPANHSQTNTLSAAFAAFSATTANTVSTITTPSLTLLTISKPPLLLAIASQTPNHPIKHLKALARDTLTTVYTCLSASFIHYLTSSPTSDTASLSARFQPLLNKVIISALTYPLSPTLSLVPSLPAPLDPASHNILSDTVRRVLSSFKNVSHVIILIASPPYPRRIIASVSPANSRLLSMDLLVLLQLPPPRINDKSQTPDPLFLPTCGFRKGFRVALRAVNLQVDSDGPNATRDSGDKINFQSLGVVGSSVAGDSAVWLMALGHWKDGEEGGNQFLDQLESSLDQTPILKDVMVAMERPWKVSDITGAERCSRRVRAVLMLGKERFVGTVNAFGYCLAHAVSLALDQFSGWHISYSCNGMLVVIYERRYIVIFDSDISEEDARCVMREVFVPWMKRFKASLMFMDEGTTVQPATPLAGFLAPFPS